MPKSLVVIPRRLRTAFQQGIAQDKIIFFSAGAGWGKTTAVNALLEKQAVRPLSLRKTPLPHYFSRERLVLLDDFQDLPPQAENRFQELLRNAPEGQRFILLSRAPLPEYLSVYVAGGALLRLCAEDLALDADCLFQLAEFYRLPLSAPDLQRAVDVTGGSPVAVKLLFLSLAAGRPFRQQAIDGMYRNVGAFMDETVLRRLEPAHRGLLMELSPFDCFEQGLAETLAGKGEAAPALEALRRAGILIHRDGWRMADQRFLRPYLQEKLLEEYPPERYQAIHRAGGRWYALQRDFKNALLHYQAAGSRADLVELVRQNLRIHLAPDGCRQWQEWFELLTEDEIRSCPNLICAMSMLQSVAFRPEEAEKWYAALSGYVRRAGPEGRDYPRVRGLLLFLDVSLPHRGVSGLPRSISAADGLLSTGEVTLPKLPVTGGLPSVLRGTRDFSQWMERQACGGIRAPLERLLGRDGTGLWEIALAEGLLEKGEDISGRFLALMPLQKQLRSRGALEMEFALTALLVRALYAAGNLPKAKELLWEFRTRAERAEAGQILRNIDAMRCRLSLLEDGGYADAWFDGQPPKEQPFYVWDFYLYLAKARCYIRRGEHHAALLLLGWMLDCARQYSRPLDALETLLLAAVCRFRMGGEDWRTYLSDALQIGCRYGYSAAFAREGAALLPLLERYGEGKAEPGFWRRILPDTILQAGYYEHYLQPLEHPAGRLTKMEASVLQLLAQNKSNGEICALLDIKLPTVKTHIRNLFRKLRASSRTEALQAAKRLGLV